MSNILVGLSGGIACYKTCSLVSQLVKLGHSINVIMTENATKFVAPLTLETLSHNPVITDTFNREAPWEVEHISLAKKADICIVAPATANIIAKIAHGIADDMLTTTLLATKSPVIICPAMNTNMYDNVATQNNLALLKERGFTICEPDSGYLACGDIGKGRMSEPNEIAKLAELVLKKDNSLCGKRFLVTAGGTRERIDGVRFITNRSSGKMGVAIAKALADRGADVELVVGTVSVDIPANIHTVSVTSAEEMYKACMSLYKDCDCAVMAAAVGDYSVKHSYDSKIKGDDLILELKKNVDIAKSLGEIKKDRKLIVFCAETDNLIASAEQKLINKNADMIVANDVSGKDSGFEVDYNTVTLLKRNGWRKDYPKMLKSNVASVIVDEIITLW